MSRPEWERRDWYLFPLLDPIRSGETWTYVIGWSLRCSSCLTPLERQDLGDRCILLDERARKALSYRTIAGCAGCGRAVRPD